MQSADTPLYFLEFIVQSALRERGEALVAALAQPGAVSGFSAVSTVISSTRWYASLSRVCCGSRTIGEEGRLVVTISTIKNAAMLD